MIPAADSMAWVLSREVVVGLAIAGGVASLAALGLRSRARIDAAWIARIDRLAYVLMGASIVLFVIRGLVPVPAA